MQIIINRTAVIVDDYRMVTRVKVFRHLVRITRLDTVYSGELLSSSVLSKSLSSASGSRRILFLLQAQCNLHALELKEPLTPYSFGMINKYWDPTSKCLICIIDAALNYYFIRSVKQRLVKYHGLVKYTPLVTFNTRLLVISIAMDVSTPFPSYSDVYKVTYSSS